MCSACPVYSNWRLRMVSSPIRDSLQTKFAGLGRFLARSRHLVEAKITLHPILYRAFQVLFLAWSLVWWRYPPAPGKAVLLLAAVATIVTIQPQMTDGHRLVWMVIMSIPFFVKFRSIDHDRYIHDKEQAEIRATETQNFREIGDGIKQAIRESQSQFAATMKRSDQVIGLQTSQGLRP